MGRHEKSNGLDELQVNRGNNYEVLLCKHTI